MAHQEKSRGKTDQKRDDKCGRIGLESDKSQVEYLFMENMVVSQPENKDVQDRIGTPAGSVSKSL